MLQNVLFAYVYAITLHIYSVTLFKMKTYYKIMPIILTENCNVNQF